MGIRDLPVLTAPIKAARYARGYIGYRRRLDDRLKTQMPVDNGGARVDARSVIITGPPRIGKSSTAKTLSAMTDLRHVELDGCMRWLPEQRRQSPFLFEKEVQRVARMLIDRPKSGVCLDVAIMDWEIPLIPETIAEWVHTKGLVIISSEGTAEQRLDAIMTYRETNECWTRTRSDAYVARLAQLIVDQCNRTNELAAKHGFPVFLTDGGNFAATAEAIAKHQGMKQLCTTNGGDI